MDLSSLEDLVPEMFLAVSNGLHLSCHGDVYKLVGGGLVAETRAVLVDIIVIMGRQVMLKVKGKHIVSCEQQVDSLPRGRGELLEERVASEEELSCKSSSKVDSTDFALDEELDY